ncbi:MAG TPA: asparagine synthase (glutamine-hydrolyzing) [Sphingomicrobium sp.]|nr:asparagine synthase (glutamine-hydrolyzing) [Sphingomicrobium sp.]
MRTSQMCGIAGWYRRSGDRVSEAVITAQCDTIVHRGPDDSGTYADGDFGFGMRRLSIIDVEHGHQPMFTPDGRYSIVFNGEIYNHLDLRPELEAAGARFETHSDTETLLASYAAWGDDCWLRLDGMFAVAIWDRETRTLTLARDPLGIKPLYLSEQNGGIAFGSEIRALRSLPDHDWDIDERSVSDFFSFGHVLPPRSIYRQAHSLPPGHSLKIGPRDRQLNCYWRPQFRPDDSLSDEQWIEETRSQLLHTVKRHMLADVPVGAFLSGGVDSSAIAAAMRRVSDQPIKAFTIGFPGTSVDETAAAESVARHLGVEHHLLPLQPAAAGDVLPMVQASFDEPCAATAALPIWYLSRFAANHVKVVLCGEGSDEIFAGYKRQRTALRAARAAPWIRASGRLANLLDHLPRTGSSKWNYQIQNARRFRDSALLGSSYQRFFAATQISTPGLRATLYEENLLGRDKESGGYDQLEKEYFGWDGARELQPLDQLMLADLTFHMPASLLNRLDRSSMAHSLEARVPFLSREFVDWSLTMPTRMKLRGGLGKVALRKAIEPWVPAAALSKRKLGFQIPFADWFKSDFAIFAREAWNDSGARRSGYLRPGVVDRLFEEHEAGLANHGRTLFAIAMFSCWWQQTMSGDRRKAA